MFTPNDERSINYKKDVKRSDIPTGKGVVEFSLSKWGWNESDCLNSYEWEARLIGGGGRLLAVAVGSLFLRKRGNYYLDEYDLAQCADQMSEADLILVDAYLEGPGSLFDGYEQFCTVLAWERHPDAPRGSGLVCLQEAIKVLKRKYRALNTIVINSWPQQFAFNAQTDAAKTAAMRLEKYIFAVRLQDWLGMGSCVPVHPLHDEDDDPHDRIYGKYVVRQRLRGGVY